MEHMTTIPFAYGFIGFADLGIRICYGDTQNGKTSERITEASRSLDTLRDRFNKQSLPSSTKREMVKTFVVPKFTYALYVKMR